MCLLLSTLTTVDARVPRVSIVTLAENGENCLTKTHEHCFLSHRGVCVMDSPVMERVSPELVRWFMNPFHTWIGR